MTNKTTNTQYNLNKFNSRMLCSWESGCINFDNLDSSTLFDYDLTSIDIFNPKDKNKNG